MVDWINQIVDVDVSEFEPAYNSVQHTAPMRRDEVTSQNTADAFLRNVPHKSMGYVVVPKVVDTEDS